MANQENHYQAFFKDQRLGDFIQKRPKVVLHHTPPEFQSSQSADKAHAFSAGPSAWYEITLRIAFKRGYAGAEGRSAFWDRIRQWMIDLQERMQVKTGHSQWGPLSFVRDPNGIWSGEKDKTTVNDVLGVQAGTPEQFITTDDISISPFSWAVDDYLLFIEPGTPVHTFPWEIAQIDVVSASQLEVDSITYAKVDGTAIYRLDWYMPEVALTQDIEIDGSGAAPTDFVKEIELHFGGVMDPVQGGL